MKHDETIKRMQVEIDTLKAEKGLLDSKVNDLRAENDALLKRLSAYEKKAKELVSLSSRLNLPQ